MEEFGNSGNDTATQSARRDLYEGFNHKTFTQERNLDLSNTNSNNIANTYNNY